MVQARRRQNEKKFGNWEELLDGGRRYWYEVSGRIGWKARYIKEVDNNENTLRFYQEIYNSEGKLIEIHEKYPIDRGHQKVGEGENK
ncbi:MAG TPA: hypothetical protein DEA73_07380 [Peptococcaceae bacterium]|nr:MAG: hypothetical protein XD51_0135 [Moorella sp. 60_41]HBT47680.1 hypothetical protein [Peptococcaceae bacterium]